MNYLSHPVIEQSLRLLWSSLYGPCYGKLQWLQVILLCSFLNVIIPHFFQSFTNPWRRLCSLEGVWSPWCQSCHEGMAAFCQSWDDMFSFHIDIDFYQSWDSMFSFHVDIDFCQSWDSMFSCCWFVENFLKNTCWTSHFAVGCFSMSSPRGIRWVRRFSQYLINRQN